MGSKRGALIRAYFDATSDLTWMQTLEPKFRQQGVEGAELQGFREAWNRHTEARDWAWWQNEAKAHSNADLERMLAECIEEVNALGMMQWRDERLQLQQLWQVKAETPEQQHLTNEKGRER